MTLGHEDQHFGFPLTPRLHSSLLYLREWSRGDPFGAPSQVLGGHPYLLHPVLALEGNPSCSSALFRGGSQCPSLLVASVKRHWGYRTKRLFSLVVVQMWPHPCQTINFFLSLRSSPFSVMLPSCKSLRDSLVVLWLSTICRRLLWSRGWSTAPERRDQILPRARASCPYSRVPKARTSTPGLGVLHSAGGWSMTILRVQGGRG